MDRIKSSAVYSDPAQKVINLFRGEELHKEVVQRLQRRSHRMLLVELEVREVVLLL
jgi:hypothetical protein